MTADQHKVTIQHLHGLLAAPKMRHGRTILADTDDGLRFVSPDTVFNPEAKVRRILITLTDLADDIDASGMSASAFLRENGARLAGELNKIRTDGGEE